MGADIHSVAQADWNKDGKYEDITEALWEYYHYNPQQPVSFRNVRYINRPFDTRFYAAFSALGGVRGNEEPLIHPLRGIPDGVAEFTDEYEAEYTHSGSWATFEELEAYADRTENFDVEEYIRDALSPLRCLHEQGVPVRIVYAFDN